MHGMNNMKVVKQSHLMYKW